MLVYHLCKNELLPTNDKKEVEKQYPNGLNKGIQCWLTPQQTINFSLGSDYIEHHCYEIEISDIYSNLENLHEVSSNPYGGAYDKPNNDPVVKSYEDVGKNNRTGLRDALIIKDVSVIKSYKKIDINALKP